MSRPIRISVLGAGSWGTTVASIASANASTLVWARHADTAEEINREHRNGKYLGDLPLNPALRATASLEEAVSSCDVLVLGVPSHGLRATVQAASPHLRPWVPVVSLVKGLEQKTHLRMTEIIAQELPGHPAGLLAGPNIAREILQGMAAAAVIAMPDPHVSRALQPLFSSRWFRVYTNDDVAGCELGGPLKNVIAIAAGMAEGFGVGVNTRATVITRGLAELTRFGVAFGGRPDTFAGLTGLGDSHGHVHEPVLAQPAGGRAAGQGPDHRRDRGLDEHGGRGHQDERRGDGAGRRAGARHADLRAGGCRDTGRAHRRASVPRIAARGPRFGIRPSSLITPTPLTCPACSGPGADGEPRSGSSDRASQVNLDAEALSAAHFRTVAGSNLRRWPTRTLGSRPEAVDW